MACLPWRSSLEKLDDAQKPTSCQSNEFWIGALFASSNRFSVILCISAFMSLALSISITFSLSLRWTRFVAPVRGSPVAHFILCHLSRCSLRLMISLILLHLVEFLRSIASLYLLCKCSHLRWLAYDSFSLINLRHAAVPTAHSSTVRDSGLLIPTLATALNTFPLV